MADFRENRALLTEWDFSQGRTARAGGGGEGLAVEACNLGSAVELFHRVLALEQVALEVSVHGILHYQVDRAS